MRADCARSGWICIEFILQLDGDK